MTKNTTSSLFSTRLLLIIFYFLTFIFNFSLAMDIDSQQGKKEIERKEDPEILPKIVENIEGWKKVAAEWGISYEVLKAEAFLINYQNHHPSSNFPASINDLIVLPPPDKKIFAQKLEEFGHFYGSAIFMD